MGLCVMATTAEEFMSFQLLSEEAIQPYIGLNSEVMINLRYLTTRNAKLLTEIKHARECLVWYPDEWLKAIKGASDDRRGLSWWWK